MTSYWAMMQRMRALILVAGLCLAVATEAQQNPPAPTPAGLILGRVVDAQANTPVNGVVVTLSGQSFGSPPTGRAVLPPMLTDAEGRFAFRNVPAGTYMLTARTGGHGYSPSGFQVTGLGHLVSACLNGGYGQRRPDGPLGFLEISEREVVPDAEIKLWKGAIIEGAITDEAGEPLIGVAVAAARRSADGRILTGPSTRTDDRGYYRIPALLPGDYVVVVPNTQTLTPIAVAEATARGPADPSLPMRLNQAGAPQMQSTGMRIGDSIVAAVTSPGIYVVNNLAPVRSGARTLVYQTTFHPAATSFANATPVRLGAGQLASGIDVRLLPVAASEVSGTLTDDRGGVPAFGLRLLAADRADGSGVLEIAQTMTAGDGRFSFPLVPAGAYRLMAARQAPMARAAAPPPGTSEPSRLGETPGASAMVPIVVGDQPVHGVAVSLRPPRQIAGRFEWTGAATRPTPDRLRALSVGVTPVNPILRTGMTTPSVSVDGNGEFVVRGVAPGRHVLAVAGSAPGWVIGAITAGGRDVTYASFTVDTEDVRDVVIAMIDRDTSLRGSVPTTSGVADAEATVYVFPADRARWPDARATMQVFRSTRTTRTGAFTFGLLLPGEYLVAAVRDDALGDWPDLAVLTRLAASATAVRLSVGQNTVVLR